MESRVAFPRLAALLVAFWTFSGIASPLTSENGIAERDNKYLLHCSNAPGIIAGK